MNVFRFPSNSNVILYVAKKSQSTVNLEEHKAHAVIEYVTVNSGFANIYRTVLKIQPICLGRKVRPTFGAST